VPVRFASLPAGPDRAATLDLARALRAAGVRVESVTDTAVLIRDEDRGRAQVVIDQAAGPPP
jgi:hypothetical protein